MDPLLTNLIRPERSQKGVARGFDVLTRGDFYRLSNLVYGYRPLDAHSMQCIHIDTTLSTHPILSNSTPLSSPCLAGSSATAYASIQPRQLGSALGELENGAKKVARSGRVSGVFWSVSHAHY